ncbi:cadherin-7a isoform X1 [Pygocentrus nattereri]|uniref:Cadherin 7a n=1 Tax=Pygocentrus nattereri TaxID=42514 RepID=A0AAR2JI28_PYGNA|nr:cadherin-7a isoform X1 [Pygocentrus nattereri]
MSRSCSVWGGLSIVTLLTLVQWESCCWGMTLNSVQLHPASSRPARAEAGTVPLRHKRNWVWNQFFVLEEYTGDDPLYVGKLHSDVDKGEGRIKYVLTGEGATTIFTIDENTGDIHATKRLDREEQAYYTLRAQARDRATNLPVEPESEFVIKVQDINDNEPKFPDGPYQAHVPEMSPVGTSVVEVKATDADDPTYGNSARVVYSILEGQPYFSVEPKTGIVRTALPNMDREARDQYLLVIQAKDMGGQMGGLSGTTTVTVTLTDVNDNPPRFSRKSYQFAVPESLPVASVVAKIKALDSDVGANAEMEYRIIEGDGLGVFRVEPDADTQEGVISLQKNLDFETKSSYTLKIEASNKNIDPRFRAQGPFSDTAMVKLVVENVDEPPVFSSPISRMSVSEAAKVGTIIGTVSALDPDSTNSPIRYSIDRNTDLERFFNIEAATGVISTAKPLDREVNAVHNITILAIESLDPAQVGKGIALITVMDVNDNAPVFAIEYETFVCETAQPGQVIETISAVDKDEPPSGHRFFFSLTAEAAGNHNFTLRDNKDNTASVLTKRGGFQRREQAMYRLPVLIVDSGSPALSSTNTLSIRVCDCDSDGTPQACGTEAFLLSAGLSTGALMAILACILTLLVLVLLIVTVRRRKKEPLILDEDRDVRENIVRYDDEGGGEEDTEAFDMVALRNLNVARDSKARRDVTPEVPTLYCSRPPPYKITPDNGIFRDFIWDRLKDADVDPSAPPYDSLQTYAFEGSGSVAESLSSLESLSTDSEQSYDYLSDWGPRFKKLADLYGHNDSSNIFSS